jgi:hypothetical protein
MTSYVSADLRREVVARAQALCEYCLIHESDTYLGCQVDHVISEKHGGATESENLAYACTACNRAKGTDLGSIHSQTGDLTRFFNPRTDKWADHFETRESLIHSKTPTGEVTARLFGFNTAERLLERDELRRRKRYPSSAALAIMIDKTHPS